MCTLGRCVSRRLSTGGSARGWRRQRAARQRAMQDLGSSASAESAAGGRRRRLMPARDGTMAGFAGALPQPHAAPGRQSLRRLQNDVTTRDSPWRHARVRFDRAHQALHHRRQWPRSRQEPPISMRSDRPQAARQGDCRSRSNHLSPCQYPRTRDGFEPAWPELLQRRSVFDPVTHHTRSMSGGGPLAAVFEDVGLWKRARYFPAAGED